MGDSAAEVGCDCHEIKEWLKSKIRKCT